MIKIAKHAGETVKVVIILHSLSVCVSLPFEECHHQMSQEVYLRGHTENRALSIRIRKRTLLEEGMICSPLSVNLTVAKTIACQVTSRQIYLMV